MTNQLPVNDILNIGGGLFIQSTPHIDLVDRRPQLKIVSMATYENG
jgi:hypothetical protein